MHQTERDEVADQLAVRIPLKPRVARPIPHLHLTQTLRLLALATIGCILPVYGSSSVAVDVH